MAVRDWSKMLSMSARDTTPIAPLMGEDENSIIQVKTETRKDKGDSVTFSLLARLEGDGYSEGQTTVGNAEAMTLYAQSAVINEIGHVCSPRPRNRATKRINLRQASNMMSAVKFARNIGAPLNAHATIHWAGTKIGDDPDGNLFAKVREGFDKWLKRHGLPVGLTAIWVRERLSGGSAEVVHCHVLFHLPHPFTRGRKRIQVEKALDRLIDRHGDGNFLDCTLKLTFPSNPNGLYLIKGGGPDVWRKFGVPSRWRKSQGLILGKRCGVTENIGAAARTRWRKHQDAVSEKLA